MLGLFLEGTAVSGIGIEGLFADGFLFLFLYFLFLAGAYVFVSFAFMSLAKKAGDASPGLAWIPGVGPLIIAFRASKMHWWPWLLLVGFIIPFVQFIAIPVFVVFEFIWTWKLFQAVGRPGWWTLLLIIPLVGIIILAVAAWGNAESKSVEPVAA